MNDPLSDRFLWIGHRGAMHYNPQNSLRGFEECVARGISWIETDIRMTRNNVPVLFHDEFAILPGGNTVSVHSLHSKDLTGLDIGMGERVPSLRELFERFSTKLWFDLELKVIVSADCVVSLVREFGLEERVLLTSFIPDALQRVERLSPSLPRGLLIDRMTGNLTRTRHVVTGATLLGCRYILPDYRLIDREMVQFAHQEGLKIIAWTVNEPSDSQQLIEYGVDGIISDRPDFLREQAYFPHFTSQTRKD